MTFPLALVCLLLISMLACYTKMVVVFNIAWNIIQRSVWAYEQRKLSSISISTTAQ